MTERFDKIRDEMPEAVGKIVQVIADNPAQFLLFGAGVLVFTSAAHNLVRPKGLVEVAALFLVTQAALPYATKYVVEKGILKFRVRDSEGKLIEFEPKKLKAVV